MIGNLKWKGCYLFLAVLKSVITDGAPQLSLDLAERDAKSLLEEGRLQIGTDSWNEVSVADFSSSSGLPILSD